MKKFLLLSMLACGITSGVFAQTTTTASPTTSSGIKFSIGAEPGLPIGDVSNLYSWIIGGSAKVEIPTAKNTFITLSAGYSSFMIKSDLKDFLGVSSSGFVPIKAGIKYYSDGNFFLEGQAGIVFSTESGGGHAFVFSPGIGYTFNGGLEAGVRYEGWSNGGTTGQIALRLAYRF